jgi:D-glycero-D-manno-heptose 1,7-bisphosphate phosphatase
MISWISSRTSENGSFLFLDRDGVVNVDRAESVRTWDDFEFYPDALESLRWLRERGLRVILVSNQSALNRGWMTWGDFWDIHRRMIAGVREAGGDLLAAFYCPHRPDESCCCRKPAPGQLLAASRIFGVPLESTYMIGNRLSDAKAAASAGCRIVLLDRADSVTGRGERTGDEATPPHLRYSLLSEAVTSLFS